MAYEFSRMNGTSFERMARALAFDTFGTSGVVYSSGADGGRDFTIEGRIPGYEAQSWDGYLVLQSKYKEHTGQKDDVEWLIAQIDSEFEKYSNSENGNTTPEYYLVATNIRLSGTDGIANKRTGKQRTGGYTKVSRSMEKWKEIGVKGWDIWHADKIVDLLNGAPEVRQSFSAWVTPGDVLSKVLQDNKILRADFKQTISRAIRISLHRDQFARLKDAGSVNDDQIRTSQVFIDLPLPKSQQTDEASTRFVVASLVERAKEKLDPESTEKGASQGGAGHNCDRNKIVLVGGPGQGKSTATLFLTQIFRAAIVDKDPATRRDHNLKKLVPEVLARATSEGISSDVPHRYPLSISLPRFADAISLAKKEKRATPSLLAFIAQEIAIVSDGEVSRAEVRDWLGLHPWLLVLDGLDEVPATGERPSVISAVNAFFSEVAEANADLLTIVTTRPQGYNKDLDPEVWEHWGLAELSVKQALDYAKGFGEARYREDKLRRSELLAQLSAASKQPATARLMTSPLQVTILHFIVDTGGGVPAARWTLFNEYFEVLKRRERAKGGETQRILEHHWGQLGPLHHRIGLILQSDSEHAGGAGGKLSHERLRGVVSSYLDSEGFSGSELDARVEELMTLALNRLVLLSTQEEGQVQFDVRSLQEFMAAAALTSGDQDLMETRLSHLAGKTHWRHVFLIAASRCFSDDSFHYRRSAIVSIARQLDASESDIIVRNGARLAIELLADGIGGDHPISRRKLLIHALDSLSLGGDMLDDRLEAVWDESTIDILHRRAEEALKHQDSSARATWVLLINMARDNPDWVMPLIRSHWPANPADALKLLDCSSMPWHPDVDVLAVDALIQAGPTAVWQIPRLRRFARTRGKGGQFTEMVRRVFESRNDLDATVFTPEGGFSLKISRISQREDLTHIPTGGSADWEVMQMASEFSEAPTKETLSNIALRMAESHLETAKLLISRLPWPIATLLHESDTSEELRALSKFVADGDFGDGVDWSRAERRWQKSGISERDFLSVGEGRWFASDVAQIGCPPFWIYSVHGHTNNVGVADKLSFIALKAKRAKDQEMLASASMFALHGSRAEDITDPEVARRLFDLAVGIGRGRYGSAWTLAHIASEDATRCNRLSHLVSEVHVSNLPDDDFGGWHAVWENNKEHRSLIRAILAILVASEDETELGRNIALIGPEVFVHRPEDEPAVAEAIAVGKLMLGMDTDLNEDIGAIVAAHRGGQHGSLFEAALERGYIGASLSATALIGFIRELEAAQADVPSFALQQLRKALDSRRSELAERSIWVDSLQLPLDAYDFLLPQPQDGPRNGKTFSH